MKFKEGMRKKNSELKRQVNSLMIALNSEKKENRLHKSWYEGEYRLRHKRMDGLFFIGMFIGFLLSIVVLWGFC